MSTEFEENVKNIQRINAELDAYLPRKVFSRIYVVAVSDLQKIKQEVIHAESALQAAKQAMCVREWFEGEDIADLENCKTIEEVEVEFSYCDALFSVVEVIT